MCGLVVHGLTSPTMRGCSSYPTHSEGQRLLRFLCRSSPHSDRHSPRSRHESLPSHDVPGGSFPTVWVVADAFRIVAPKPGSRPEAGQGGADILAGRRKRPAVRAAREKLPFPATIQSTQEVAI